MPSPSIAEMRRRIGLGLHMLSKAQVEKMVAEDDDPAGRIEMLGKDWLRLKRERDTFEAAFLAHATSHEGLWTGPQAATVDLAHQLAEAPTTKSRPIGTGLGDGE